MALGKTRILYLGDLRPYGTCIQRMKALQDLGFSLVAVSSTNKSIVRTETKLWNRIFRRIVGPSDLVGANAKIVNLSRTQNFNILWLDKALTIKKTTIQEFKFSNPESLVCGYSGDDMKAPHNQSKRFLEHLPFYDVFFTTKSYGVKELEEMGCKKAFFIGNAFDPNTHRPLTISDDEKRTLGGGVGFIGTWEPQRAASINYLADHGVPVRVWGTHWWKNKIGHKNLKIENRPVYGDKYAMAICSFDINLCFLRKLNRDLQTTRSVEIPACGAFMLAERSDEHLELFREGVEAEFFGSDEELLEKTRYYLVNPEKRRRIAFAGRQRCIESGYSNHEKLKQMLSIVLSGHLGTCLK